MLRTRFSICSLILIGCATATYAADDASLDRMKKDLNFLAGEECEGRGLKTNGINKAAVYIADEFKAAGLKSPFPDGSYFQPFTVKETFLEAGPHKLTLSGPDKRDIDLAFDKGFRVSGLSGKGVVGGSLVFAGYGISTPKYDDYKDLDVKNKIVVVLRQYPRVRAKKEA